MSLGTRESLGGRLQWPSQTFPDHARLPPTVFTITERPPNDLWRPRNVLTRLTFIPDHSRLFWTVQNSREHRNTSTVFTDLSGPYQTSYRPFPTYQGPYTTFPDHQGRERSASKSAKCDQGFNQGFLWVGLIGKQGTYRWTGEVQTIGAECRQADGRGATLYAAS